MTQRRRPWSLKEGSPSQGGKADRAKRRRPAAPLDKVVNDLTPRPALPAPAELAAQVAPELKPEVTFDHDPRRTPVWWQNLEKTVRAGGKPLEDIAFEFDIGLGELEAIVGRRGWDKSLADTVVSAAKAIEINSLAREAVSRNGSETETVADHGGGAANVARAPAHREAEIIDSTGAPRELSTDEVVEAAAQVVAGVLTTHRKSVRAARAVVETLVTQLGEANSVRDQLVDALAIDWAKVPGMETAPDKVKAKVQADLIGAIFGALSLPSRSKTAANLAVALDKLVRLERTAHGLDVADKGKGGAGDDFVPIEERVRRYTELKLAEGAGNVRQLKAAA